MCVGRVSLLAASSRFCFQFQFNCVALLVAIYFLALPMPLRKRGIKYFTFVSTHQKSIRKNEVAVDMPDKYAMGMGRVWW